MIDKIEILSNELIEINNIIALAKADSEIEQILITEIAREFNDELTVKVEQVFYQDQIIEIIELAKHDRNKMITLLTELLKDDTIHNELKQHFYDFFGSQGELKNE